MRQDSKWRHGAVVLTVCVAILTLALAGCGGGDDEEATSPPATTESAPAETAPADTAASADTGAPSEELSGEGLTIGQVLYSVDAYQQAHSKFFEERARELGAEVQTANGEASATTSDRVARDLLAAGVNAMIIQPPDPGAAAGTLQAIIDADVPVVYWGNGEIPGIDAPYIELDEREQTFEAGANAANYVIENFDESPKMVVIDIPGVPICEDYRMGQFIEGVRSVAPDAEIVAQPDGAGVRAQSQQVMDDVLRSGVDFNILTACNGESILGALSALERAGRGKATDKKPETEYIFTIDGSPAEIEKLTDPNSSVMETLMLTPYDNARHLAELTIQNALGELPSDYREGIGGVLVGPDCEEANALLEKQFGETVEC